LLPRERNVIFLGLTPFSEGLTDEVFGTVPKSELKKRRDRFRTLRFRTSKQSTQQRSYFPELYLQNILLFFSVPRLLFVQILDHSVAL
ncbi:hypothetical protein NPIL_15221, partial [Nephila pilipes]